MSMWYPPNETFFETVWRIVARIPMGKVSTYGQIASMIPLAEATHHRLAPRWVGTALRQIPDDLTIAWHRVINSQGKISLPDTQGEQQRRLLESEDIVFDQSGKIDLRQYGWLGPDERWLKEQQLLAPIQLGLPPQQPRLL